MAADPVLAFVVARGRNGVIGRDGALPWRLRSDLRRFRDITWGKPVVMGRRTWESLPRALPGRPNLVVSRDPRFRPADAFLYTDLSPALAAGRAMARARDVGEVCVIGGAAVFAATLGAVQRLYLTDVDAAPEGDAVMPAIDEAAFREVACEDVPPSPQDGFGFRLRVLERRRPPQGDATA